MEAIGRHVYGFLKNIKPELLTDEQREQIDGYENTTVHEPTDEQRENREAYSRLLFEPVPDNIMTVTKDQLWRDFSRIYYQDNNVLFSDDKDSIENIKVVMMYFLKDESFFDCKHLTNLSDPSFDKGLLIIGNFGNGKTSIMKAIHKALMTYRDHSFACYDANDVVNDYDACKESIDKDSFWRRITSGRAYFDDVKTEREGSNYGKVNLFKDILERRDSRSLTTHLTGNYKHGHPNDLNAALVEYGERYGGRVHDRLFRMFNIIEFKGKSFRK